MGHSMRGDAMPEDYQALQIGDGKMAGLYGRAARQPIVDGDALDVAILLRGQEGGCE